MCVYICTVQAWHNYRATWEPQDYNGIDKIHMSANDVWVPDIIVYNAWVSWHNNPDSKVHGVNMRPIWGWQDPGGPHGCPMHFAIWECKMFHNRQAPLLSTHLPLDKMAAILADDIFKCIFLNETYRISIQISLKLVPRSPIDNKPEFVQVMAWRQTGDKPLPEPMMTQFTGAYMRR